VSLVHLNISITIALKVSSFNTRAQTGAQDWMEPAGKRTAFCPIKWFTTASPTLQQEETLPMHHHRTLSVCKLYQSTRGTNV